MKYFSEVTNELYDTEEELLKAEKTASSDELAKAKQEYEEAMDKATDAIMDGYKKFCRYLDLGGDVEESEDKEYDTLLESLLKVLF